MNRFRLSLSTLLCFLVIGLAAHATEPTLDELLKQGDAHTAKRETKEAMKIFQQASVLYPRNAEVLYRLAREESNLAFATTSIDEKKALAKKALDFALAAVQVDPKNANAHLSVAVCYGKSFALADNQTKVNYSKLVKSEAEMALQLDPKSDLAHHMLGRWHYEVSNMNFLLKGLVKIAYGGLPQASNEDSIQHFKKAIELNPARILHHRELARVYLQVGRKDEAIKELSKCAVVPPMDKDDEEAKRDAAQQLEKIKD